MSDNTKKQFSQKEVINLVNNYILYRMDDWKVKLTFEEWIKQIKESDNENIQITSKDEPIQENTTTKQIDEVTIYDINKNYYRFRGVENLYRIKGILTIEQNNGTITNFIIKNIFKYTITY